LTLSERLREYIIAAFSGIWVQSHEHADALREIAALCKAQRWALATWDVDRGLCLPGQAAANAASDPVAAIKSINALAAKDGSALLVLPNFHRFLQSTEVVQALAHQLQAGKQNRTFIIVLSPIVQIPVELEKGFVVIEHDLPDKTQIQKIAEGVATEACDMPEAQEMERLLDAAAGLTREEAESAFSLSIVRHGGLQPQAVWELKTSMLKKSGLLMLHRGSESFAELGGLDQLKHFCTRAIAASRRKGAARARGILLLSPPGCGKSQFCKALGNETGRPTLILDVGSLMGSLVGQTEERVRNALRIVDAMSPSVLFIDELDKALAGVASSGSTDSGVSARLFGSLLTWLSDHTSDTFVVATANNISSLPPEFARAERFDGVFFIDLPSSAEKQAIWPIHLTRYGLSDGTRERRPADQNWTGAEIQSCCRLASLLDLPLKDAAKNVVPVAVTAAESVEKLRAWAAGRCLDASLGGIYTRGAPEPSAASRRISRPSSN
jgi:hypothetical protein